MRKLCKTEFETTFGQMTAVSDERFLYLLEFSERKKLDWEISRFDAEMLIGETEISEQIEQELMSYFSGRLKKFTTPVAFTGSEFQKKVWITVAAVPYGRTATYKEIAEKIGQPSASLAVGAANGANQLAIIVPCHRLIRSDGGLAGYAGGLWRKEALLKLEGALHD